VIRRIALFALGRLLQGRPCPCGNKEHGILDIRL